ncbi:hypothetical protein FACS189483_09530 [Spirochaetia bacterium]|nr:hypothetical protein FACS189483_09530 [Spirochaetia bacterium]
MSEVSTQEAERLLEEIAAIQKRFADEACKTGSKFNIFEITGSGHKEVQMCRILAELLDPKGRHGKGSLYLKLFWETVSHKLPDVPKNLDFDTALVSTEYSIDAMRRIDITIKVGKVFVPIEVKIWAGDQPNQIHDYFVFSRDNKNGGASIPVLYLTLDGHRPTPMSARNANEYITLSFNDDIIPWLEKCVEQRETENTTRVCETLKQLIGAVKQLCDNSEDTKMTNDIFELVAKSGDSVKAALAMGEAAGLFGQKALEAFKGQITGLVQKSFPDAEYEKENDWRSLCIPIRKAEYLLYVNYDWKAMTVQPDEKIKRDSALEKNLSQKMMALTGDGGDDWKGKIVWAAKDKKFCYPTLGSVDESLYFYELWKVYTEHSQEVADRIISIARELESVN